jgi:pyruvate-ferredoxin/flavodoxin oxidoreductase
MAVRSCGWAQFFANNPQEVHDFALISQAATLASRVPFLHVFDGFRTSHEQRDVELLSEAQMQAVIPSQDIIAHRQRALAPEHGVIRGTAQNPDVFFQSREAQNTFYDNVPQIVEDTMNLFAQQTGRRYQLFEYIGHPEAEHVLILMGSGADTVEETILQCQAQGERVGVVKVRLYRPFSMEHLWKALPTTTQTIAVLDRTKEPGAAGEPLFQDVSAAVLQGFQRGHLPRIPALFGGRYGLGSKEFTPAMVKGILQAIANGTIHNSFTVGINDDLTHRSLPIPDFVPDKNDMYQAVFWGLGSDGTVGANKNSIKIIGSHTSHHVQGYFVYDSKKSGARTISHLRIGQTPFSRPYLIEQADFVGIHQFGFLDKYPVLDLAAPGATVLLNSPYSAADVWDKLPTSVQQQIRDKGLSLHVVDAHHIAQESGIKGRINTVMQTGFFQLTSLMPAETAFEAMIEAIQKTYGKRGKHIVERNVAAMTHAKDEIYPVVVPPSTAESLEVPTEPSTKQPTSMPDIVNQLTVPMMEGKGDQLPVSALPSDGTYPSDTARWEKRNLALDIPVWDPDLCIQCGKCVMLCPHAVIRSKRVTEETLSDAPESFQTAPSRWKDAKDERYTLQVAAEDCTGCRLCVEICPAHDKAQRNRKALAMQPQRPLRESSKENWSYFLDLPEFPQSTDALNRKQVKDVQLLQPLFAFSGACAGCGETPYLKLLSQLFGERTYIANATGCSSIYGGNLPTTPWGLNKEGRGPAWSNSLFEDNAEFGLGMRLAINSQEAYARTLLRTLAPWIPDALRKALLEADQSSEPAIEAQRQRVKELDALISQQLASSDTPEHLQASWRDLQEVADTLVKKSVWIVGGDGWAYDIGYGGLDHVLASGANVNVLVLDTEVYSNTGGQASKATPRAAVAKFAAGGKRTAKKDLAMMAIQSGDLYVARVAMGANEKQTLHAFLEAEAYPGPSLIIAYSPCIAHGIDMSQSLDHQKAAVKSGYWPLYRYNPERVEQGQSPMQLDSKSPSMQLRDYFYTELRFRMLQHADPATARQLLLFAQQDVDAQWQRIQQLMTTNA